MGHSRAGGASAPVQPGLSAPRRCGLPEPYLGQEPGRRGPTLSLSLWRRSQALGTPELRQASQPSPAAYARATSNGAAGRAGGSLRSQHTPDPSSALSFRLGSPFPRGGTGPTRATEEEEGEMTKYLLSSRHFGGRVHWTPPPPPPASGGRTHVQVSHWGGGPPGLPLLLPTPAP